MESIRTVLIEDEARARQLLARLLRDMEFPLQIVGEADDVRGGIEIIEKERPELIFLDINLQDGTAFDLLNQLPNLEAEVIFATAYDQYAIRAFDFAALGYLLKPLRISELREAIQRFVKRREAMAPADHRLKTFLTNQQGKQSRLVVPDVSGFRVVSLSQIIFLRGEVNYTRFFLDDGSELLTSKTLKEYERLLSSSGFCRIHQSYLINLTHVKSYQRGEGGVVCLAQGHHLDVSRRRKAEFMRYFVG
jgi:two-component system LytT family response regulator